MKSSYIAIGVVGLALGGLWYAVGGTQPPTAAASDSLLVSAPVSHENLTVFFVHGPDAVDDARVVSLQEALECGLAVVHETGNVNTLAIENVSADRELFVQSDDIIKGGRQDRMIAADMLVPPRSGLVPVAVHCVEQGRWTGRQGEVATRFATSNNCAVGNDIKLANANRDQFGVWANVKASQDKLSKNLGVTVNAAESRTSLQLALENPAVQAKVGEYEAALRPVGESRRGVVGVVFAVNGKVSGAEVYGSNGLFRKAWPKLLKSAAVEALAGKDERPAANPPSCREVELFLASAAKPEANWVPPETLIDEPTGNVLARNEFAGRSGATRSRLLREGGGNGSPNLNNEDSGVTANLNAALPEIERLEPAPNPPPVQPGTPATTGRVIVSGETVTQDRVILNQTELRANLAAPTDNVPANRNPAGAAPAPVNPDGNRLNTNRVDNRSTLMTELKDPGRNAVIHRSYIKK